MPVITPSFHPRMRTAAAALALCLLLGAGLGAPPVQAAAAETLSLQIGTQHELVWDEGIERVAVADDKIAAIVVSRDAKGTRTRVLVTPQAPGSTTLMVWPRGAATARAYALDVRRPVGVIELNAASTNQLLQQGQDARAGRAKDDIVLDRSTLDVRGSTVQVDVKVVEFNRTVLKRAGLNLFSTSPNSRGFSFGVFTPSSLTSSTFGAGGALAVEATSPVSQAFNLLMNFGRANIGLSLGLLEESGAARVLAEPTLVALSGQSANFLAGGEIPVPVSQGLGTTSIQYKPFGIGLTVYPTVLSNDRIVLKVAPEASDLDYTNAVTLNTVAVPAITTRRADTTVELGDGESFVIGGLVSRTTFNNIDKVPGLGDLPVLGAFFRNQNYRSQDRELVIVVTPHLVKPLARGAAATSAVPAGGPPGDGFWRSFLLGGPGADDVPGYSR